MKIWGCASHYVHGLSLFAVYVFASILCIFSHVNKCCALLRYGFQVCVWLKFKESCDTAALS